MRWLSRRSRCRPPWEHAESACYRPRGTLARHYSIGVHAIESDAQPQLTAYRHAYETYAGALDWIAFIDGDEFLHPAHKRHFADVLTGFDACAASAIAMYWKCYGSNGHLRDPDGLLVERYPRHSAFDFLPNRHVKSIVRGRQRIEVKGSAPPLAHKLACPGNLVLSHAI